VSTFAPGVNPCIMVMVRLPWAKAGATASAERPVSAARRVKLVVMVITSVSSALQQRPGFAGGQPAAAPLLRHAGAVSTL
jgi:hypothetical protein